LEPDSDGAQIGIHAQREERRAVGNYNATALSPVPDNIITRHVFSLGASDWSLARRSLTNLDIVDLESAAGSEETS